MEFIVRTPTSFIESSHDQQYSMRYEDEQSKNNFGPSDQGAMEINVMQISQVHIWVIDSVYGYDFPQKLTFSDYDSYGKYAENLFHF